MDIKSKPRRTKSMISIPAEFWIAIDNMIDGRLINSRGDAIIDLILDLQQARPGLIKFDEMITIKMSEYQQMNTELAQLRAQMNAQRSPLPFRPWLTEDSIKAFEVAFDVRPDTGPTHIAIICDEVKTTRKANEMIRQYRADITALKKRIAELEGEKRDAGTVP